MELMNAMTISTYGMKAQGERIRVISENLANADTAPNVQGEEPYQRKVVSFKNVLDREMGFDKVEISKVSKDDSDFPEKYMPGHPGADDNGYVKMPNVKAMVELMDMREAQRTYEANINMMTMVRGMANQTIGMLDK